tara:strand:+ start:232 stop:585 length:354 start_codon:yes stop_codon:yes gene_type:complete
MKNKFVWNVIIWKANGDENIRVFVQRPDFANIYPLINCDMIEFHKGYHEDHGTFEMHCDEEAKLTSKAVNKRATKAWYAWQMRTGHMSLPGDTINGDVAILKKVKQPNENTEVSSAA